MTATQGILIATLVVIFLQLLVFLGQLWIMKSQAELAREHAVERRDAALATFYRMTLDLVEELSKTNDISAVSGPADVDYNTHPRQILRQASHVFAPLGNRALMALHQAGIILDEYFREVSQFNRQRDPGSAQEHCDRIDSLRRLVGDNLDLAAAQLGDELRWKDAGGKEFSFSVRCSNPNSLPPSQRPVK
jgi:hypothetical protein